MTSRWRGAFILAGAATVAASVLALGAGGDGAPPPDSAGRTAVAALDGRVVGPGRVEPISEEIEIGVEVGGRITALTADEGDRVRAGQVLAELDHGDYRARLALAEARLADARAVLARIRNGARPDERREARAAVASAEAVEAQAEREAARRDALARDGVVAREDSDRAGRDLEVARARLGELRARLALVEAGPRAEDHRRAEADVAAAEAGVHEARARLAKMFIRAPIDGTILRRRVRVGETLSPEMPGVSLFTLADLSRLRVRVDVDEHDVGAVRVGQRVHVTAPAYAGRRFDGRVIRVGRVLGRKNIRTDEPRERVDTKILETLVALDPGADLPIGLRVDAAILTR
jgi:HlyD family secretion protein